MFYLLYLGFILRNAKWRGRRRPATMPDVLFGTRVTQQDHQQPRCQPTNTTTLHNYHQQQRLRHIQHNHFDCHQRQWPPSQLSLLSVQFCLFFFSCFNLLISIIYSSLYISTTTSSTSDTPTQPRYMTTIDDNSHVTANK